MFEEMIGKYPSAQPQMQPSAKAATDQTVFLNAQSTTNRKSPECMGWVPTMGLDSGAKPLDQREETYAFQSDSVPPAGPDAKAMPVRPGDCASVNQIGQDQGGTRSNSIITPPDKTEPGGELHDSPAAPSKNAQQPTENHEAESSATTPLQPATLKCSSQGDQHTDVENGGDSDLRCDTPYPGGVQANPVDSSLPETQARPSTSQIRSNNIDATEITNTKDASGPAFPGYKAQESAPSLQVSSELSDQDDVQQLNNARATSPSRPVSLPPDSIHNTETTDHPMEDAQPGQSKDRRSNKKAKREARIRQHIGDGYISVISEYRESEGAEWDVDSVKRRKQKNGVYEDKNTAYTKRPNLGESTATHDEVPGDVIMEGGTSLHEAHQVTAGSSNQHIGHDLNTIPEDRPAEALDRRDSEMERGMHRGTQLRPSHNQTTINVTEHNMEVDETGGCLEESADPYRHDLPGWEWTRRKPKRTRGKLPSINAQLADFVQQEIRMQQASRQDLELAFPPSGTDCFCLIELAGGSIPTVTTLNTNGVEEIVKTFLDAYPEGQFYTRILQVVAPGEVQHVIQGDPSHAALVFQRQFHTPDDEQRLMQKIDGAIRTHNLFSTHNMRRPLRPKHRARGLKARQP